MEQVLRIFRKDVRHLWPSILVVLLLIVVHAVFDVRSRPIGHEHETADSVSLLLEMLLPLAIWFLIAQVIFQETLPGEQQFWLTRPYSWRKLLGAKVLFVFVFVSIPLFLSDCSILAVQGLPVLGDFSELLLRQLIVAGVFILPSFALAAITTGLVQFLLAWFLLLLTFITITMLVPVIYGNHGAAVITVVGGGDSPLFLTEVAAFTCGIVVWQYARRRTFVARLMLAAVICMFLPFNFGMSLVNRFVSSKAEKLEPPNGFNIRISYDRGRPVSPTQNWERAPEGHVIVRIPVAVSGVPPENLLRGTANTTIDGGGKTWPGPRGFYAASLEKIGDFYWQAITLEKSTFAKLKQQPANLHITYNVDILKDEVEMTIPVTKPSFFVPGVGICHSLLDVPQFELTCRAGLTPRIETVVRLDPTAVTGDVAADFRTFSIPWGLSPTTDLQVTPFLVEQTTARLVFIRRRKLAEFRQSLDVSGVQLTNYVLER